jgi:hypothetical protein
MVQSCFKSKLSIANETIQSYIKSLKGRFYNGLPIILFDSGNRHMYLSEMWLRHTYTEGFRNVALEAVRTMQHAHTIPKRVVTGMTYLTFSRGAAPHLLKTMDLRPVPKRRLVLPNIDWSKDYAVVEVACDVEALAQARVHKGVHPIEAHVRWLATVPEARKQSVGKYPMERLNAYIMNAESQSRHLTAEQRLTNCVVHFETASTVGADVLRAFQSFLPAQTLDPQQPKPTVPTTTTLSQTQDQYQDDEDEDYDQDDGDETEGDVAPSSDDDDDEVEVEEQEKETGSDRKRARRSFYTRARTSKRRTE